MVFRDAVWFYLGCLWASLFFSFLNYHGVIVWQLKLFN